MIKPNLRLHSLQLSHDLQPRAHREAYQQPKMSQNNTTGAHRGREDALPSASTAHPNRPERPLTTGSRYKTDLILRQQLRVLVRFGFAQQRQQEVVNLVALTTALHRHHQQPHG